MKNLSVKDLKRSTRKLYNFNGTRNIAGETTTTTSGDPTTTTATIVTSHLK